MVIRRRFRAILYPVLLYCVSGAFVGYFVWHAVHGDRGLKAKEYYHGEIGRLRNELAQLKDDSHRLSHKVELLRGQTIDRDLLQEEAELQLGRVGKDDLVVIFNKNAQH
jgi:cell division protein FtsB